MKVVAYGIRPHEKVLLAKVNRKVHEITIIANELSLETVNYSAGKNALLLTNFSSLPSQLIEIISGYGIGLIITWNASMIYILHEPAVTGDITLMHLLSKVNADAPGCSDENNAIVRLAQETISVLNSWQQKI